jgi:hypothetical protein
MGENLIFWKRLSLSPKKIVPPLDYGFPDLREGPKRCEGVPSFYS